MKLSSITLLNPTLCEHIQSGLLNKLRDLTPDVLIDGTFDSNDKVIGHIWSLICNRHGKITIARDAYHKDMVDEFGCDVIGIGEDEDYSEACLLGRAGTLSIATEPRWDAEPTCGECTRLDPNREDCTNCAPPQLVSVIVFYEPSMFYPYSASLLKFIPQCVRALAAKLPEAEYVVEPTKHGIEVKPVAAYLGGPKKVHGHRYWQMRQTSESIH